MQVFYIELSRRSTMSLGELTSYLTEAWRSGIKGARETSRDWRKSTNGAGKQGLFLAWLIRSVHKM